MNDHMNFPITLRLSASAQAELEGCEYGSYEDHIRGDKRESPYDDGRLHIVEIIQRSPKTRLKLRNQAEVDEVFGQALTGTFGLYFIRTAERIWDELSPYASAVLVARIPRGSLGY